MRIDLIWLTDDMNAVPGWNLGTVVSAAPNPAAVARAAVSISGETEFVLFWDAQLGRPDPKVIALISQAGGDVWHSGLLMGMAGLPEFLNYVNPGWRFTVDPPATQSATSWRLSLRACMVRADVIRQLGGPDPEFDSLAAAALELGHRWISAGALMRFTPDLVQGHDLGDRVEAIPAIDEFRFVRARFGRRWALWAMWRAAHYGGNWRELWAAYDESGRTATVPQRGPYVGPLSDSVSQYEINLDEAPTVAVLIPTLDRYPHLFTILDQLREQSVPPLEIIVIDQTDPLTREPNWPEQFADLPLRVIWEDVPGQCSSRNAGLQSVQAEAILFLDDDDEIEPDLIERHVAFLLGYGVDASCGVALEVGAGSLPHSFTFVRDSDVFPTNNTLLYRHALQDSGLFDLAYERGARADGDLGMRLYLAGKLLVLNPAASVLHLHAPRGGLRQHKARVVTNASSRASLMERHFLSATEAYLLCRYFTPQQVDEAVLIRTFSSLGAQQTGLRRWARALIMVALLPDTHRRNRRFLEAGRQMMEQYPAIPELQAEVA